MFGFVKHLRTMWRRAWLSQVTGSLSEPTSWSQKFPFLPWRLYPATQPADVSSAILCNKIYPLPKHIQTVYYIVMFVVSCSYLSFILARPGPSFLSTYFLNAVTCMLVCCKFAFICVVFHVVFNDMKMQHAYCCNNEHLQTFTYSLF